MTIYSKLQPPNAIPNNPLSPDQVQHLDNLNEDISEPGEESPNKESKK